ncbi:GNAT family N-acetyltransferase [Bradyrhizobium sp.]|jgi:GNAT superfamily N-acetyltransferase|uniref:GNAT family N-acetyltransferase n=1 Tax=Bradyrhizobium sp. TaxID=376 RepID=UPI002CE53AB3|nr:GNAT family N-acetyltransferase [Bradyrhizobium sp.]HWX63613.1 GNAT family N-acetyltransferase [Bradyrhizobium sp.]
MRSPNLVFQFDDTATPDGRAELCRLIHDVFEVDVSPLDRLGHDPSIISFGWWQAGELIANVSLYRRELWLAGKQVEAFGVQSVAVRPEWRGRGLFRDLLTRALDYADARVELVILVTGTPDLYTPFGFRSVVESSFLGQVSPAGARQGYRRLSLDREEDASLLRDLFSRGTPVSLVCAARDHPALFFLKAIESPDIELVHLPDLDAIVAIDNREQGALILLDVVAPAIPPLDMIAATLGNEGKCVRVNITPDRLAWNPAQIVPANTGYMVRGHYAPEGQAFRLSPMRI